MWFHLPWHAVESWIIKMHESFSFEPNQELQLFSDLRPDSRSDICFWCTVSTRCCSTCFPLVLLRWRLARCLLFVSASKCCGRAGCSLRQLHTAQQEWCPGAAPAGSVAGKWARAIFIAVPWYRKTDQNVSSFPDCAGYCWRANNAQDDWWSCRDSYHRVEDTFLIPFGLYHCAKTQLSLKLNQDQILSLRKRL